MYYGGGEVYIYHGHVEPAGYVPEPLLWKRKADILEMRGLRLMREAIITVKKGSQVRNIGQRYSRYKCVWEGGGE